MKDKSRAVVLEYISMGIRAKIIKINYLFVNLTNVVLCSLTNDQLTAAHVCNDDDVICYLPHQPMIFGNESCSKTFHFYFLLVYILRNISCL